MTFTLREATPDDAETVPRLHLAVWRETYGHLLPAEFFDSREAAMQDRVERHREALAGSYRPTLAFDDAGVLVGMAFASPSNDDDAPCGVELQLIYALQRVHGTGVGQALLDAVIGKDAAYLWVLEDNPRAQAFYRRNGFVPDGTREVLPDEWEKLPEIRMVRTAVGQ